MSVRKLQSYLGATTSLATLSEQVKRLRALQGAWESLAFPALAQSCKVGSLRDQTLVLYASNGAVAAKTRQLIPSILEKFQKMGFEVTVILVRVQARSMSPASRPQKALRLGMTARDALRKLADQVGASPLQDSLTRMLERHAEQNDATEGEERGEDKQ